ncbi:MAG: type III-A CRISPR-associated protein Cas10/Csm1 [Anaerolineales bacterium]
MEEKVLMAALAGLLHDVGKFGQRAGDEVKSEWSDGKTKSDFGYQHALHSWHFANKYLPEAIRDRVRMLAAYHHRPHGEGVAIQLADHLSAGERRKDDVQDDSDRESHPKQLHPVFITLKADEKNHPNRGQNKFYFPLQPLRLEQKVLFASQDPISGKQVWDDYKALWDAFCAEAGQLKPVYEKSGDWESYLEAMQALFSRYAWCVPAAYFNAVPDISLYDHSRMTAALAACLVDFPEAKLRQIAQNAETDESEVALLVGGDISGVQAFIYTISSKGAAKMLRGRSFYLQLLTEAVLRFVLQRLGLPYTNVIYSGGGHFYLLAPLSARDELPKIQAEVGKILYHQHGTQLYLVLGSASVPAKGFTAGKLQDYWQKMHNQLTLAKNRRYAELGKALFDVFELPEHGGNPDQTCSVCGDDSRGASNWDEWEGQSKICPLCRSFAETLGKDLPDARFLALKFGEPQTSVKKADTALDILGLFGMDVQFLKIADAEIEIAPGQQVVLWALDDPQNGNWPKTRILVPRWLRYTANRVPPLTFDELQQKCESGFQRLGVLRMDVDNLGHLFKDGLDNAFSLSRMAALSSQISLFFEGWLKRIVENKDWHNLVYTVYSGGDDLFLLAPWDKVPALAQKIVDDFAAYTAHPGMHISGGMAFIDGKYPIYQAAEDAEEAEQLAKDNGRNSFAFLNKAWKWNQFRELSERKDQLSMMVKGETSGERGGPKSILQTLRALARMEEETRKETGRSVWGRWKWMGAYHLARMEERYKNNANLKDAISKLREKLGAFEDIEAWGAAARWAQLEMRNRSN